MRWKIMILMLGLFPLSPPERRKVEESMELSRHPCGRQGEPASRESFRPAQRGWKPEEEKNKK